MLFRSCMILSSHIIGFILNTILGNNCRYSIISVINCVFMFILYLDYFGENYNINRHDIHDIIINNDNNEIICTHAA